MQYSKKQGENSSKSFDILFRKNTEGEPLLDLEVTPTASNNNNEASQPQFDQILDLGTTSEVIQGAPNNNGGALPTPATPLIAFEESITTSPKQEVPTGGQYYYYPEDYKGHVAAKAPVPLRTLKLSSRL